MHRHQGHCLTRHDVGCKLGGASNDIRNGGREGLSRAAVSCRRLGETGGGEGMSRASDICQNFAENVGGNGLSRNAKD